MKNVLRLTVGLVMFGTLLVATGAAQAQSAAGPYYPTPSWDQTFPTPGRFVILTNMASAAVWDRETGLVWEKSPDTATGSWNAARFNCVGKNVGGRKGWRLPSVPELASLVDPANTNLALPTGHPFVGVQSADYWSATSIAETPTGAWDVNFNGGFVTFSVKTDTDRAWCVRGDMNAEAY